VLSAYNHEKNILQCLDSIIAQENADMQKSLYLFFRQENSFISSIFKNSVFRNYRRVVDDITEMLEVIVGR
jgi:hypothetical protein